MINNKKKYQLRNEKKIHELDIMNSLTSEQISRFQKYLYKYIYITHQQDKIYWLEIKLTPFLKSFLSIKSTFIH